MILDWFLVGNTGICFNFYAPFRVEQRGDDNHGSGGTDETEKFAVDAAGGLPVFGASEVHTGTVDMFDGASGVFEGRGDKGEALIGLFGDVRLVCTNRAGAGDMNVIADTDGAGEADHRLEGRGAGDIASKCHVNWMLQSRDIG